MSQGSRSESADPFSHIPISEGEIVQILTSALKYPSGDNCQPFRLQQHERDQFLVFYLPHEGEHVFNMGNISAILSLGALIESLSIAASQCSCVVDFRTGKDFGSTGPEWGTFVIERAQVLKNPLADYVEKRFTNRKKFQAELSEFERKSLQKNLNKLELEEGTRVSMASVSQSLEDYFLICDELFWTSKKAVQDLARWIRLKFDPIPQDGFSLKNLCLKFHEALALLFFAKFPFFIPSVRPFLNQINKENSRRNIRNSAGIVFIGCRDHSKVGYLKAGRSLMRVWLELTKQGYQVQPLSLGSTAIYGLRNNYFDLTVDPSWKKTVLEKNNELKMSLNFRESEEIIWAFRFGRASADEILPEPTGRRRERFNL
jgi:hypothetical protein